MIVAIKRNLHSVFTNPHLVLLREYSGGLEQAHKDAKNRKIPHLPLWMTPVQACFAPVDDNFIDYCLELGKVLDSAEVRYDIDYRSQIAGKMGISAEKSWVLCTTVIYEKEKESGRSSIRRCELKNQVEMRIDDLSKEVQESFNQESKILSLFFPSRVLHRNDH